MSEGAELRHHEWPSIRRLVVSYVAVFRLSYDDAEDVVQRAMIRIWRGWGSFEGRSRRSSWVYRVVRNEFLTWRRTKGPKTLVSESPMVPAVPSCEEQTLLRISLQHRLDQLDETDRTIVLLCFLDDLTSEEVGERLGMAASSVRCRVLRLRRSQHPS